MSDDTLRMIRLILIGLGGFLAGTHGITSTDINTFTDNAIAFASAGTALFVTVQTIWAKWGTHPVPLATAARVDVPTVNPLTGAAVPAYIDPTSGKAK